MKKYLIIAGVLVAVIIIGAFVLPPFVGRLTHEGPPGSGQPQGGPEGCASMQAGEWMPERDECPSQNAELSAKCDAFCVKHPDCCGDRTGGEQAFGGREKVLTLPSAWEIFKLKRNYPETIKALNEGPNIYSRQGASEIIGDEKLEAIKAVGFNAIQVLLIGKKDDNGKLVFNEVNNSVLLNDIVAIKKHGLAVWVALDIAGAPTNAGQNNLGKYADFKESFLAFTKESAELMEKYKVEYFTANNEPDKLFKEQKQWSAAEINANLADFFPATNAVAREKFKGKLINKITQTQRHPDEVVAASFKNVDIAGVDVGPSLDGRVGLAEYQKKFDEYQFYASLAQQAGVPWMNAEYWQGDFDLGYYDFAKQNELKYAQVSFNAYLKAAPKGQGYVWNDWATFSLPQGEATREALSDFFKKI
ncbi:MAG: hypothetical protein PHQ47_02405 [Candidatus Portnoybacteria bacterium]|nr:hypothetical protein [Candidatus Portnoybacteria bacterium]